TADTPAAGTPPRPATTNSWLVASAARTAVELLALRPSPASTGPTGWPLPVRVSSSRAGASGWSVPVAGPGPPAWYWHASRPKQTASRSRVGAPPPTPKKPSMRVPSAGTAMYATADPGHDPPSGHCGPPPNDPTYG